MRTLAGSPSSLTLRDLALTALLTAWASLGAQAQALADVDSATHAADLAMSPALLGAEDACLGRAGDADGEVCALSALQLRANSSRDSCGPAACCKCKNGRIEFSKCGFCADCKKHGGLEQKDVRVTPKCCQCHNNAVVFSECGTCNECEQHEGLKHDIRAEPKCCLCRSGGVAYSECGHCDGVCQHKEGVHKDYAPPEGCDAKAVEEKKREQLCGRKCYDVIERHGEHGGRCEASESKQFENSRGKEAHFIYMAGRERKFGTERYLGSFLYHQQWFQKHGMKEENIRVVNGQWESKEKGEAFKYRGGKGRAKEYEQFDGKPWPDKRTAWCYEKSPHLPTCLEAAKEAIKKVPKESPLIITYFGHGNGGKSNIGGDTFDAETVIKLLEEAGRQDSPTLFVVHFCSSGLMGEALFKHAKGMKGLAILTSGAESESGGALIMTQMIHALSEMQTRGIKATFRDFAHLWYEEFQKEYLRINGMRAAFAASKEMWCYKIKNFCMLGRCQK